MQLKARDVEGKDSDRANLTADQKRKRGCMVRTRTDSEKRKAIEKLAYEIKMLARTALVLGRKRNQKLSWVYHNATVHSFLLAVRNLHHFFFVRTATRGSIVAADFVKSWSCSETKFREGKHWRKLEPRTRTNPRQRFDALISQRLHHITWSRVKESKIDWDESRILKEFLNPVEQFRTALHPKHQSPYFERAVQLLRNRCEMI